MPADDDFSRADPGTDSGSDSRPESDGADTAGLGARFLALLVDWVLCVMLAGLVARPPATGLWVYPFLIAEYGLFVGLYGQTPGMWLAKIRCAPATGEGSVGVPRAVLRTLLMCLVVPVLIMDRYGRGLHDKAANTVMLSAPRG